VFITFFQRPEVARILVILFCELTMAKYAVKLKKAIKNRMTSWVVVVDLKNITSKPYPPPRKPYKRTLRNFPQSLAFEKLSAERSLWIVRGSELIVHSLTIEL
jgi:hypothetical protein